MTVIFFLIGCSLAVALIFLAAFIWAVRSGQYEDDQTPAMRMLLDDVRKGASEGEESRMMKSPTSTKK